MFPKQTQIRCCSLHKEYPVAVLGTFKFNGKEFWCPYCGQKYEMFDGFSYYNIETSYRILIRYEFFKLMSNNFLSSRENTGYIHYQKPDACLNNLTDFELAKLVLALGHRFEQEDLVPGCVLFTQHGLPLEVVEKNDKLYLQNNENALRIIDATIRNLDLFIIPEPEVVAALITKAINS